MACRKPLAGYRPANGGPVFISRLPPAGVGSVYQYVPIPCGQCILCRQEHARQWAVRIMHELHYHNEAAFLTLTLDDEHMNELGSLDYNNHMAPFWKRLRERLARKGIRISHYSVGEYGDRTMRPHYHACIFGHAFTENRQYVRRGKHPLWTNALLQETWGMGNCSAGVLNYQTAAYTAGYVMKKLKGFEGYHAVDPVTGELTEIEAPSARMSKSPAIGLRWVEEFGKAAFTHDHVIIDGKKQKPPKYYDRWLEGRSKIASQILKATRMERAKKLTQDQLDARARVAHARAKNRSKS